MTSRKSKNLRDQEYKTAAQRPEWSIIEQAKMRFVEWAGARGVPIHTIEYVAGFEEWSSGIGVYIFFPHDAHLREYQGTSETTTFEQKYLEILKRLGYPFDRFPDVVFVFDSDENVQRNYEGSYFYRLR